MIAPQSVLISNINPGRLSADFVRSLLALLTYDRENMNRVADVHLHKSGPDLTSGRNDAVTRFLTTKLDWLLQIDSDMCFPENALDRMNPWTLSEDPKRLILGGLCPILQVADSLGVSGRQNRRFSNGCWFTCEDPTPTEHAPSKTLPLSPKSSHEPPAAMKELKILPADGVGAAFLLVHRTVFDEMYHRLPYPHWFGNINFSTDHASEDLGFCFRAKECGLQTWVVPNLGIQHEKTYLLDPVSFEAEP